ncbi:MAG: biotin-dependent carboxyltransferase [Gemmatimonadetes bacterium]|nr:biotin-dependent carboxyltransferase [Gemmatimonadota bacterium]
MRVIAPGPLSTVQDPGRPGYQRYGVSASGAMDGYALALGNRLLGNERGAAALEITLGGAEFEFLQDTLFAVTGADLAPTLAGAPLAMWEASRAARGDRLAFAGPVVGTRAYLCVAGGFDTPPALGSRATHLGSRLGGLEGRALQPGDELPLGRPPAAPPLRRVPAALVPAYADDVTLRVVRGPQEHAFTAEGLNTFYGSTYTLTDRSDRMGARLDGPIIEAAGGRYDIVSDAVPLGSVQVPGDGKPIVLLADRQTTGGYAKIAVVATADLPLIAQAAPGAAVRFTPVTVEEAEEAALGRFAAVDAPAFEPVVPGRSYALVVNGVAYSVALPASGPVSPGEPRTLALSVNGRLMRVEIERPEG